MATRTDARVAVISILFAHDSGNEQALNNRDGFYEEKKIRNKQRDFANGLLDGVLANLAAIDEQIEANLKDWDYDRIGKVDKAILRLGAYELLYTDTDRPVIINEALNIAKELCADESPKFINGVLDKMKKAD